MSSALYARDPITLAYKEIAGVEVSPGVWGLPTTSQAAVVRAKELVDDTGAAIYVGSAALGTSTAAPAWSIKRVTIAGSLITTEWAAGGASSQIWDNRASLSYS